MVRTPRAIRVRPLVYYDVCKAELLASSYIICMCLYIIYI